MQLHEYQAKELLMKHGIEIPPFFVASTLQEVEKIIKEKGLQEAVLKVQVHAGGRGKAGGVKIAKNPSEILEMAQKLLGMKIVNRQTGPQGIIARKILLSDPVDIGKEYYFAIVVDRKTASCSIIASQQGGIDIEHIAATSPESLLIEKVAKDEPVDALQWARLLNFLGWTGTQADEGKKIIEGCIQAFFEYDALLLEINPLVQTKKGKLIALDAKMTIDDNALFRQPLIAAMEDTSELSSQEIEAKTYELAYVGLQGTIGCMVNGAGLAMATMDLIRLKGGAPANFLDVGGGASHEKILSGFTILLSDPTVDAILVNIFGGIMNCKTIACALKEAVEQKGIKVPLVVRMEGTNAEEAKKVLSCPSLNIIAADTLDDAAEKVVAMAKK